MTQRRRSHQQPVVETMLENPGDPNTATQMVMQEGGVYEDLRYVGRMPEVCPLQHADDNVLYSNVIPASGTPVIPPPPPGGR